MKKICILLAVIVLVYSYQLIEVNHEGDESKDIGNIYVGGYVAGTKDKLYFIEEDNGAVGLYKSDLELKNKKKIGDGYYTFINIYKDKIYYVDFDGFAYSMNTDGTKKKQLTDFCIEYMYVFNGRIYCLIVDANLNFNEEWKTHEYNLISMNIDGTDIKVLSKKEIRRFYIYKNHLYYVYYDTGHLASHKDTGYFSRMNLDGTENELLFEIDDLVITFSIFQNHIYYICPPGVIVKRSIDDDSYKQYISDNDVHQIDYFININNPYILYRGVLMGFFTYNMNTGEKKNIIQIREEPNLYDYKNRLIYDTSFYIVNDTIYFYQNGKLMTLE